MKKSLRSLTVLLALTSGIVLIQSHSGCAATATNESTGEYVDDAAITTKVKAIFVKDPLVNAMDVKVATTRGVVALSGSVATDDQKAQAERLAAAVQGVKSVTNNITLKPAKK